jgi:MbtH protein
MATLNPFDDPSLHSYVLVNLRAQYSLWPDFSPLPAGWTVAHGPASRAACEHWLQAHWDGVRHVALEVAS